MSERLRRALKARRAAEREIQAALEADYPPGAACIFKVGDHVQDALVVRNLYGDRIEVENIRTQRKSQLYAYRLVPDEAGL